MRDTRKSDKIEKIANNENLPLKVLSMDVDNDDSVRNAIHKILDEKKKIDILVNNAGYGLFGALEEISIDEIKKQFETNLFGAMRTIKEVLPYYEKTKKWNNYKCNFSCRGSRNSCRMHICKYKICIRRIK